MSLIKQIILKGYWTSLTCSMNKDYCRTAHSVYPMIQPNFYSEELIQRPVTGWTWVKHPLMTEILNYRQTFPQTQKLITLANCLNPSSRIAGPKMSKTRNFLCYIPNNISKPHFAKNGAKHTQGDSFRIKPPAMSLIKGYFWRKKEVHVGTLYFSAHSSSYYCL